MAGTTSTATTMTKLVKTYYDRTFLERLTPNLVFHQHGLKKALPKKEGNAMYWHRWSNFDYGRYLAESDSGAWRGVSVQRVSATLMIIGDHARITTYVDMVSINSVVEGAIELFADSSALTLDFITARMLLWKHTSMSATLLMSAGNGYLGADSMSARLGNATNNIFTYSSAKWQAPVWSIDDLTSRAHSTSALKGGNSATLLTPKILRALALKLKVKHAKRFDDGYYHAIIHPDIVNQLRGSSAYIDLHKYTETGVRQYEQGQMGGGGGAGIEGIMEGFKIWSSTETPIAYYAGSSAAKLSSYGAGRMYWSFFFAQNSFGVTDFDGGINTYVKTPGPQTTSDPLNMWSTVGYKLIYTAKVLNNSACLWLVSGMPKESGI